MNEARTVFRPYLLGHLHAAVEIPLVDRLFFKLHGLADLFRHLCPPPSRNTRQQQSTPPIPHEKCNTMFRPWFPKRPFITRWYYMVLRRDTFEKVLGISAEGVCGDMC